MWNLDNQRTHSHESATRLVPGRTIRKSVLFSMVPSPNARENLARRMRSTIERIDAVDRMREDGLRTRHAEVVRNTVVNTGFRRQFLPSWMEEMEMEMERKGPYGDEAWNWDVKQMDEDQSDDDEDKDLSSEDDPMDTDIDDQDSNEMEERKPKPKTKPETELDPRKKYVHFCDDIDTMHMFRYGSYETDTNEVSNSANTNTKDLVAEEEEEWLLPMFEQIPEDRSGTTESIVIAHAIPIIIVTDTDDPGPSAVARAIGARRCPALRFTSPSETGVPICASSAALFASEPLFRTKAELKASVKLTISTSGLAEMSMSMKRARKDHLDSSEDDDDDREVRTWKKPCL